MLDHTRSRWAGIDSWAGQPLYSLAPAIEEGMALTAVMENGHQAANVAAAPGGTDVFLGFSFGYYTRPVSLVAVETYTVPAGGGTIALANSPLNGASGAGLRVYNNTAGSAITYNATAGTGVYQIGGTGNQTLTFNAAQAGASVTVTYAYSPTVIQAQAMVGDGAYFGSAQPSDVTGTIGLIRRGLIYTSNFDPAIDFTAVNAALKVGANGIVSTAGSGPAINGLVYELPTADFPFLGINFSAV